MRHLRVGVVGSRRRCTLRDRQIVFDLVQSLMDADPERKITFVSGKCRLGADNFVAEAVRLFKDEYGDRIDLVEYPPKTYPGMSRYEFTLAAYERNREIAVDSDVGYALVHRDRTGGTENTVGHYHDLVKPVYLVDDAGRSYLESEHEGDPT